MARSVAYAAPKGNEAGTCRARGPSFLLLVRLSGPPADHNAGPTLMPTPPPASSDPPPEPAESAGARAVSRFGAMSGKARGIAWILMGALLVTAMGALVKTLGQRIPAVELVTVRAVFLVTALLPFMLRQGRHIFHIPAPGLLALRSLTLAAVNLLGFWTLTVLPLVYVTSISFSKPLFVTIMAMLLLGERVRMRRGLATVAGFAGVLVMLNPTTVAFGSLEVWAAFGALAMAVGMAAGVILVKLLSRTTHPNTIIFYSNLGVVALSAVPTALFWVQPTGAEWLLLALLGLVGLAAQNCFIRAYRAAEASFVTPFEYIRILTAAVVGYIFFAEKPDIWTGLGALIITVSTLYLAHRERIAGTGRDRRDDPTSDRDSRTL